MGAGRRLKRRSCQRPLAVRGDLSIRAQREGVGMGEGSPNPECKEKDAARLPRPRLLHFPGAFLTLRALLTPEWKQPGKMGSLAHESPMRRAAAFSSPAPSCVSEERALLPGYLENRFDVADPPANGATDGTREGLFSGGSRPRSAAARVAGGSWAQSGRQCAHRLPG